MNTEFITTIIALITALIPLIGIIIKSIKNSRNQKNNLSQSTTFSVNESKNSMNIDNSIKGNDNTIIQGNNNTVNNYRSIYKSNNHYSYSSNENSETLYLIVAAFAAGLIFIVFSIIAMAKFNGLIISMAFVSYAILISLIIFLPVASAPQKIFWVILNIITIGIFIYLSRQSNWTDEMIKIFKHYQSESLLSLIQNPLDMNKSFMKVAFICIQLLIILTSTVIQTVLLLFYLINFKVKKQAFNNSNMKYLIVLPSFALVIVGFILI